MVTELRNHSTNTATGSPAYSPLPRATGSKPGEMPGRPPVPGHTPHRAQCGDWPWIQLSELHELPVPSPGAPTFLGRALLPPGSCPVCPPWPPGAAVTWGRNQPRDPWPHVQGVGIPSCHTPAVLPTTHQQVTQRSHNHGGLSCPCAPCLGLTPNTYTSQLFCSSHICSSSRPGTPGHRGRPGNLKGHVRAVCPNHP